MYIIIKWAFEIRKIWKIIKERLFPILFICNYILDMNFKELSFSIVINFWKCRVFDEYSFRKYHLSRIIFKKFYSTKLFLKLFEITVIR